LRGRPSGARGFRSAGHGTIARASAGRFRFVHHVVRTSAAEAVAVHRACAAASGLRHGRACA